MRVAIMQPYLFPYIGYFQLVSAVDVFVIYDDVNFINRGWINRNRILLAESEYLFTIPCKQASQNKLINEIEIAMDQKARSKLLKTIERAYGKAMMYPEVISIVESIIDYADKNLASYITNSIMKISDYLNITTRIIRSSEKHAESKGLDKADRLIEIVKKEGATEYINAIGGKELYTKEYFEQDGIDLYFLKSNNVEYRQLAGTFIPGLSIIDILMCNRKTDIIKMLSHYTLL